MGDPVLSLQKLALPQLDVIHVLLASIKKNLTFFCYLIMFAFLLCILNKFNKKNVLCCQHFILSLCIIEHLWKSQLLCLLFTFTLFILFLKICLNSKS